MTSRQPINQTFPKARASPRRVRTWYVSAEGFRELRRSCFLSLKACAKFLGVSVRTVQHWDTGRCRVPWSAVRLLRLHRLGDVGALHDRWAGWIVNSRTGELISPSGYSFQPGRLANWTVVYAEARLWHEEYERRAAGGVGALAPARPQAVTLQPEVWKAEVTTEALPSPPPEPLTAE
ncbi:MAG: hypothetical protein BGP10_01785 [Rhodanobacter sp. 68-29]|mgnify:CR=1 FL=1|nr:MAG: hypothetical protein ABT17_07170 [Rhodanobacter sp. SCN 69-32]OJY57562.1 MAG: hypothetical protein BGP10_01785 [Rhodanobacter sp. 68-29]